MGRQRKPRLVEPQVTEEALLALLEHYKSFMRCGQFGLSYEEWKALPPTAKAVAEKAARELEAEHAMNLAAALQSPEGALRVASEVDRGDGLVRFSLRQAVWSVVSRMNGSRR